MKIYLVHSPSYGKYLIEAGARVMFTYPGIKEAMPKWELPDCQDIMIDSGGFQLDEQTAKYPIFVECYSSWIQKLEEKYPGKISGYMNLDIKDPNEAMRNYQFMEAYGLNPIPVWKDGWDWCFLKQYCQLSEYVAIGSLRGGKKGGDYYRELFERIQFEFPFNKFHMLGLGVTVGAFGDIKPYSIDASTWTAPARYGRYIEIVNGVIKEVKLSEEWKDKIRFNKDLEAIYINKSIEALMSLETGHDGQQLTWC